MAQDANSSPFSQKAVFWLITVGVIATLGMGITSVFLDDASLDINAGNNSYSKSAIGHAALKAYLDETGYSTLASQSNTDDKLWKVGTTLFFLEPLGGTVQKDHIDAISNISPTFLVLPKRYGFPSPTNPGWIRFGGMADIDDVTDIAKIYLDEAEIVRPAEPSNDWEANIDMAQPPLIDDLQVIKSEEIEPIIWNGDGILLGRYEFEEEDSWPVYILSDPDLIQNHGIADGWNLELMTSIVDTVTDGNDTIIFDEIIHGFSLEPSLAKAMFKKPFIYPTILAILTLIIFLAAATRRFGAAAKPASSLIDSKAVFVDNSARLVRYAGAEYEAAEKLMAQAAIDVATRLNAPSNIGQNELEKWLESKGATLGVTIGFHAIKQRFDTLSSSGSANKQALMELAEKIQIWRQEMLQQRSGL